MSREHSRFLYLYSTIFYKHFDTDDHFLIELKKCVDNNQLSPRQIDFLYKTSLQDADKYKYTKMMISVGMSARGFSSCILHIIKKASFHRIRNPEFNEMLSLLIQSNLYDPFEHESLFKYSIRHHLWDIVYIIFKYTDRKILWNEYHLLSFHDKSTINRYCNHPQLSVLFKDIQRCIEICRIFIPSSSVKETHIPSDSWRIIMSFIF